MHLISTIQFLDSKLLHFFVLIVSSYWKTMKSLRSVWGAIIFFFFFFFFPSPHLKIHFVLGSQGRAGNPSTGAWWFLHHLWFFSRTEITLFGGGEELRFSLPACKARTLPDAADFSLLLFNSHEICFSSVSPEYFW